MDKKELSEKYIRIGVITSPHGIKGEVNVFPTTNDKEMFKTLESCYMLDKNGLQPKKVMGCKYFKKLVILQFEDVVDRNTSETLRQKELYIARDEANILGEKQYYVTDLIGCSCQDEEGNDFGVIKDYMETSASIILQIEDADGKEHLVPAIPEFLVKVDLEKKNVILHVLKGM